METLLKRYFGYDKFRPLQLEIIEHILKKRDTLVLMPTGGGKSICYQIPALKFDGLTLVISPLISLMKDQVDGLKTNGINAEYINSSLSFKEIINIKDKVQRKEIKILYLAPERLALENFKEFLKTLQISLIAIDEAHCISEWGHDFRPEYRNLKFLKKIFPEIPIIALTATATKRVREDILKQLSLTNPRVFISSFNRKNLNLIIMEKKNAFNKILNLLKKYKDESAIIYCFSRKDTEKIAQQLNESGFKALPYHAGLSNDIRKQNQEVFIKDKVNVIVATIAFGMGINKLDVRLIIHCTFPKSIEGYYQEIGRAGRDGLQSDCVLFYSKGDKRKHEFFIDQIQDEVIRNNALDKLNKMMIYCEDESCRRKNILRYFGETFLEHNCNGCDICLKISELEEVTEPGKDINKILSLFPNRLENEFSSEKSRELFEKLRILRKDIANQRNVPSFIIFNDVSLHEMSYYLPKNNEEFLKINGVGQQKLKDFGDLFLEAINNHVKENNIIPEKRGMIKDNLKTDYHKKLERIKEKFSNAYESWKEEEDDKLRNLYSQNNPINEISKILKRQPNAIKSRLKKFGLLS